MLHLSTVVLDKAVAFSDWVESGLPVMSLGPDLWCVHIAVNYGENIFTKQFLVNDTS